LLEQVAVNTDDPLVHIAAGEAEAPMPVGNGFTTRVAVVVPVQPLLVPATVYVVVAVGDAVTVGINLRGREWVNPVGESKYFNSIQGWQVK